MIEIVRFRLAPGTDPASFVQADKAFQEDFAYHQPGLVRRTTARGDAGWVVITLWRSEEDARGAAARASQDPAARRLHDLIDQASVQTERYGELD